MQQEDNRQALERAVASHYGDGDLWARILAGLDAAGIALDGLHPDELAPVDEFHIGGRRATARAVSKMVLNSDQHVLDVGCGIGGTARHIASQVGCAVTGIDLAPEYIDVARRLTALTGLAEAISYEVGSALEMPFDGASFDAAITIHVAMNIAARETLYAEIARVLKPGATFVMYDVMRISDEDLLFPVPWAESQATSHLRTPEQMRVLLQRAGFVVDAVEDLTEAAREFFGQAVARSDDGPPPLGIHVTIGAGAPEKIRNMLDNVSSGRIAPVLMIARKAPSTQVS